MKALCCTLFAMCAFVTLYAQKSAQKPEVKFGEVSLAEMNMTIYEKDTSAAAVILFDKGETFLDDERKVQFRRHIRIKFFTKEAIDDWASKTLLLERNQESINKLK